MNTTLLLIGSLIGSHGLVAFFMYKYLNRKYNLKKIRDNFDLLEKAVKVREENEKITHDELWDDAIGNSGSLR